LHHFLSVHLIDPRRIAVSAFLLSRLACAGEPTVISVAILGASAPVNLGTQVGQPYTARVVEKDVHDLWKIGLFEDVRVETTTEGDGTAVVFHVSPSADLRLRDVRIEPSSYSLRITIPEGAPINRVRAHQIAAEAQKQLNTQGYMDAEVDYELIPLAGNKATLRLTIRASDPVRVKDIVFEGDLGVDVKELHGAFRALATRRIIRWRLYPAYSREALESDLGRVLSLYLSQGYFDARVRLDDIAIHAAAARITVQVQAGRRYDARGAEFCSTFLAERRQAEREGILDFNARLDAQVNPTIDRGQLFRVGQIKFVGAHHYKESTIRRNFLLTEGDVFDERLLRKSLARLNQAKLFEPIDSRNVVIHPNETTGEADVTIRLMERKRGSWSLSGPVGPMSIGGPLQASIGSRLPAWGAGFSASIGLLAFAHPILPLLAFTSKTSGVLPVLMLHRPFSPGEGWKSGFALAPQLGWRFSAITYAAAQMQQRLLPALAGDQAPELSVTVETPAGEGVMYCEPPRPTLAPLRSATAFGLQLLGGLAGL
jgi:hypothetical protein